MNWNNSKIQGAIKMGLGPFRSSFVGDLILKDLYTVDKKTTTVKHARILS